jgi:hypothetical protein
MVHLSLFFREPGTIGKNCTVFSRELITKLQIPNGPLFGMLSALRLFEWLR